MNNFRFQPATHPCTCQNQHLLEHGKTCNICMGTIRTQENVLDELLPETAFNDQYFEEFEAWYFASGDMGESDMDIAA